MNLIEKKCVPCEGEITPFTEAQIKEYQVQLNPEWEVSGLRSIIRKFKFKDFKEAMAFVNKVAEVAEKESHHPDIEIHYNKVVLELSTHAIGGLSENDFILASKIDSLDM